MESYRRHGLYYPFFHVRDDRWLKIAALYWPKIVRLVPDRYEPRNVSPRTVPVRAAEALTDTFLVRRPPGLSVVTVAPRFLDLVDTYASDLRAVLRPGDMTTTALHVGQLNRDLLDALVDTGLAMWPGSPDARDSQWREQWANWINRASNFSQARESDLAAHLRHWSRDWVVMPERLVAVYTSVLAEDYALANKLQPTTDQDDAYAVANDWTADRITAALLNSRPPTTVLTLDDLAETLGFLALELVVPADLANTPIEKIIEIRERYGAEFFAFGQEIDRAAAELADLIHIRDQGVLDQYLHDMVEARFAQPIKALRTKMKRLTGDATTLAINVKTQLPLATAAGGALVTGHPMIAGSATVAVGLVAVRQSIRQQRVAAHSADPAASFLLHTEAQLRPKTLLERSVQRVRHIAGLDQL